MAVKKDNFQMKNCDVFLIFDYNRLRQVRASCPLNGASCLLNVGRVVSLIWGELSWGEFYLGRVVLGRVVFGASCPDPLVISVPLAWAIGNCQGYRSVSLASEARDTDPYP